jgi:RNA polymerase primary sigma factor
MTYAELQGVSLRMTQLSGYQATIEKMYALYQMQGFLREDEVLEAMTANDLSLVEISKATDRLMDMGVIFTDESATEMPMNELGLSDDDDSDRSRTDYETIFMEILTISPEQEILIKYIRRVRPPQHREWRTLIPQMRSGNEYAFNRLFDMYLRVVVKIALYYHKSKDIELDGAIQEGSLGLMHGIKQFDPSTRSAISPYLGLWISQYISRAADDTRRLIRLPVHAEESLRKIRQAEQQLIFTNEHEPTIEELTKAIDLPQNIIENLLLASEDVLSLNELTKDDDFDVVDTEFNIEEIVTHRFLQKTLRDVLRTLTHREQRIICMRFGLTRDGKQHTLEEIGESFEITRERVRQIEAKALRKLRQPSRSKLLRAFL